MLVTIVPVVAVTAELLVSISELLVAVSLLVITLLALITGRGGRM